MNVCVRACVRSCVCGNKYCVERQRVKIVKFADVIYILKNNGIVWRWIEYTYGDHSMLELLLLLTAIIKTKVFIMMMMMVLVVGSLGVGNEDEQIISGKKKIVWVMGNTAVI